MINLQDQPDAGSDDLVRSILDASPDCILLLDLNGQIVSVNETLKEAWGCTAQSLLGRTWSDLWAPSQKSQAQDALDVARTGGRGHFRGSLACLAGEPVWWDIIAQRVRSIKDGTPKLVVIARDVTEARSASERAEKARAELEAVLSSTTDHIIVVDRNFQVTYLNARAAESVGRGGLLRVGTNIWDAYPEQIGSVFDQNYRNALKTQKPAEFEGYVAELGIWLAVRAFPTDTGLSIFFHDITEARETREQIYHLAHHDALTGLPNRALFLQRLEAATAAAVQNQRALAVIYVDLDDFKSVNDMLGHDAGDAVLVAASNRLRDGVPRSALVARLGGDEFGILLEEDVEPASIEHLVTRLRAEMEQATTHRGTALSCRASFGIALFPHSDERPSELMKNADLALYEAKRLGGDQHAFFDPQVRQAVQQRVSALACARNALDRDAILPFYQPKVCLRTGAVKGFEALLRWKHPRQGIMAPGLIKEAFEDPILSVALGSRMLQRVIADMSEWRARGLDFGSVAINVSAPEFVRTAYAEEVLRQFQAAQLPPSCLEIEVTETVFLDDAMSKVEAALAELHRSGVSIALDDFGTGYASLMHLNKFPVSWVKIDRSFVSGLDGDPDARAIVGAVVDLSHTLGMKVVAEGVETLGQWRTLKKKGCDLAQGYLISKPMFAERVPYFLANWTGIQQRASAKKLPADPVM